MSFRWTGRQFVGGALCLDFTNTVYYGEDPERRGDRFAAPRDVAAWCRAARRFDAAGRYAGALAIAPEDVDTAAFAEAVVLRQAIDNLFRAVARGGAPSVLDLRTVLFTLGRNLSGTLAEDGDGLFPAATSPTVQSVHAALAHSAAALSIAPLDGRLKACPNCHWLFLDRSRNASRVWCDMLTCGNRAKAERHYAARRHVTV